MKHDQNPPQREEESIHYDHNSRHKNRGNDGLVDDVEKDYSYEYGYDDEDDDDDDDDGDDDSDDSYIYSSKHTLKQKVEKLEKHIQHSQKLQSLGLVKKYKNEPLATKILRHCVLPPSNSRKCCMIVKKILKTIWPFL